MNGASRAEITEVLEHKLSKWLALFSLSDGHVSNVVVSMSSEI